MKEASDLDPALDPVDRERQRRFEIWRRLQAAGAPHGLDPSLLRELGVYGGQWGIWVDKRQTESLTPERTGVTVSLLHNILHRLDDLLEDGILYRYPHTERAPTRDENEILATKAAARLHLPLFVITIGDDQRDVFLGWVEAWDDEAGVFLISFGEGFQPGLFSAEALRQDHLPTSRLGVIFRRRDEVGGRARFRFEVLSRYGRVCGVCGMNEGALLEAIHLIPLEFGGANEPENGLLLCANHRRAYEAGLFAIRPQDLDLLAQPQGPSLAALQIRRVNLRHLPASPDPDSLLWRWNAWRAGRVFDPREP